MGSMMSPATELAQKPTYPDVPKLNAMSKRILMLNKVLRPGSEQSIISGGPEWGNNPSVDQIIKLQGMLGQHGPGAYRFIVQDEGGHEKVEWVVRQGPEEQQSTSVAGAPGVVPSVPVEGVQNLGYGVTYNEALGLLSTPFGMFEWTRGQPLPEAVARRSAQPASTPMATTTLPVGMGGPNDLWPRMAGDSEADRKVKMLEERLRDEKEERERERQRAEMAQMQSTFAKAIEDSNTRFEKLIAEMRSSKPEGPSEEVRLLKQQLEDQKRRDEDRLREDRLRQEMRDQQTKFEAMIRELSTNKSDPMMAIFQQIITGQQQSTVAQAESAKEIARIMAERFSITQMTPERMIELFKTAKDQSVNSEVNKGVLEMFKTAFDMSQNVLKMQAELNSAGSESPWVSMARQAMEQVGSVSQLYATRKAETEAVLEARAQQAALQQQQAPRQRQIQMPPSERPTGRRLRSVPAPAVPAAPEAPTAEQQRAEAATKVFGVAATTPPPAPPAAAATGEAAATGDTNPPATNGKTKKGKKVDLSKASPDEVRQIVKDKDDEWLFGSLMPGVDQIRKAVSAGLAPVDRVADEIMSAPARIQGSGETPPRALELLITGHIDVLIERLLPEADPKYRAEVADAIRIRLRAEAAGAGGDDGEEEAGDDAN